MIPFFSYKTLLASGSSDPNKSAGWVVKNGSFPTTRPDGTALEDEDYVRASGTTADFPFTISGVTFEEPAQKAYYDKSNRRWLIDAGAIQDTAETPTKDKATESLSGTSINQKAINIENVNEINILGKTFTLTETDADSIRSFQLLIKDRKSNELLNKTLSDFILKTRKIAGEDLADDITAQEIQDAIKELTVELKNKTIDADSNTISNLEVDNLKSSVLNKKTEALSDDDTHLVTSGKVKELQIDNTNSAFTFDDSDTAKDKLKISIKDGASTEVLNKEIELTDKITFNEKSQALKNKTLDCDTTKTDKDIIQNLPLSSIANQTSAKAGKKLIILTDGSVGLEATGPSISSITASPSSITAGTATNITITIALTKGDANLSTAVLKAGTTTIDTKTDFTSLIYTVSHNISAETEFSLTVTDADGLTATDSITVTATTPIPTYTGKFGTLTGGVSDVTLYSKAYSGTVTMTNDKIVYKYPASLGNLTSILGNGVDYSTFFTLTTEEISGVQYYVYTQNLSATVSNFSIVFS